MHDCDANLSLAQMKAVGINHVQGRFVFVIGGQRYDSPRIRVEFLSANVCVQHLVDPSISKMWLTSVVLRRVDNSGY
jgi:hypothetical protein